MDEIYSVYHMHRVKTTCGSVLPPQTMFPEATAGTYAASSLQPAPDGTGSAEKVPASD